jgi:hypothetical protein
MQFEIGDARPCVDSTAVIAPTAAVIRNNLRVLEQKINSHEKLSEAEKVEMQQYISRCYGSLTTFNILFQNRDDQFSSKA